MAIEAQWRLNLHADCPHCGEYVDLLDADEFWHGRKFVPCEHETDNTRGVMVYCPECGGKFEADFVY